MATKVKKQTSAIDPQEVSPQDNIFIKGARVHNLKNVSVGIPRNKLVVVTGVSGSGKSSLTMDTLYAEGQRRYAESLSSYARQFLMRMNKPDVDYIKGICPAIAIEQKVITRTPRSTVGSMTEIYDYLRLLFGRIGKTYSPVSGQLVKKHEVSDVVDFILKLKTGSKVLIIVPFRRHAKRDAKEELNILLQKGFSRLYVPGSDNSLLRIEELLEQKKVSVPEGAWVLIDRLVAKDFEEDDKHRIADSVQTAFYESEGDCFIEVDGKEPIHFSNRFELDGIVFEEPVPNLFSFNNPYGACPTCEGFGQVLGLDKDLVIPDKRLSVYEGAIAPWRGEKMGEYKEALIKSARKFGFPVHKPIAELTDEQVELLWTGNEYFYGLNEFFKMVEQNLYKVQYRVLQARYRGRTVCPTCEGARLRKEALYIKINDKTIAQLVEMPVSDLKEWFDQLTLNEFDQQIGKRILLEINHRLKTLLDVGLGYLTLNRVANTLSGGESQRIQLTRTLGSNLTNSMYILDEPSIGLHARDTNRLIGVLKELRDLGNTVVVVEHDELMMEEADYIIDMGPLASHLGGEVVFAGTYQQILKDPKSLTGKYLSGNLSIDPPAKTRKWKKAITLEGCRQNNLKNITVDFPLGVLTVISGVSGSGKTTLVKQILYPALMKLKGEFAEKVGNYKALTGAVDDITAIEMIDQNPIGKSSRSNPVTYIKAYDEIRDLFARQPLSKMRGFQPKHFSFNVDGGRCDACKGEGEVIVEMQFLADVHLLCESCGGKRFKDEVLEVTYKGKNIYDVLEMGVDEALEFFKEEKDVCNKIRPLSSVGLGYVKLGQSSDTLSGGEAQRVKLASFLGKGKAQGHILFIFDEPTTGLHFHDIRKLLDSFNALIDQGHTVLVIEHNLDVIRSADWLIDLGPEGGANGGNLLYAGVPEGLKSVKESYTARFLK
ncbi:excinuclease ABC subunit A [Chitinophaga terrae (ex Kim and Jung 2007)]|uniref:UvrABC system protein A n=1 Tax=Chitinophaga terrae (ex Kim and Jung 2007) TaxID=408074 RepID=A0A1H3Y336_9BACT|nr:excinuclease ABC subunit UvrA [Chitinophaga terrae (ex Kim and Jung 2007)]MDQ0108039.1 excinuclease ABC subunit A [Chitinophaga terrae (ex Kim and Jung 2007)]SEA06026.1 excinuclease ABC subunit A [Chitinophaga terrae (ex Kim and Jung 2007)]